MSHAGEPSAAGVAAAAARTVRAGTARLFSARSSRSPVPGADDQSCEGVADLRARRARVSEILLPASWARGLPDTQVDDASLAALAEPRETIYDGANAYINVAGQWTGFFLGDPAGPRSPSDPLWPLDALFGARDDAGTAVRDEVRGVAANRYRLTVDLARADAALPAGVSVPAGPYRKLLRMPAEVWLDEAGLVRRAAVSAEPPAGAGVTVWSVVELWDFGVAAEITPPGPGEVVAPRHAAWDTPGSAT